ncbi:MAG: hypothetical protein M0T74_04950 [Desulfitobacterium hafniense]|nr:hypothetical protein [Desulfitobacterium hafniense]
MSYRVQFTITDAEYKQLSEQSTAEGFPTMAEMCKTRALKGKNTYTELYARMVNEIAALEPNSEFYLRDIIDIPPALLGRWLYDNVRNGKIPNVEHLGNDGTNPEKYRKK